MAPSQKMMEILLKHRGETKGREFSRPRNLEVVFKKKSIRAKGVVNKFLAVSPVFMRKYGKGISLASHLISANYKKLVRGEVINEKGFVIKRDSTGEAHKGRNTVLSLSVSFKDKLFFVKIGVDCGERTFIAYQKAKNLFKSMNNEFNGFKVEVVPYHFVYNKHKLDEGRAKGFLVSDFFPKSKVSLVLDIERFLGEEHFFKTKLGTSLVSLRERLGKEGFTDFGSHNCFFDEVKNTIYFFDLGMFK